MKKNNDALLDKMIVALRKASLDSGKILDPYAWWPLNAVQYGPLYSNDFYADFFRDYKRVKKEHTLEEISAAYSYPSAIWLLLVAAPIAMKAIGFTKEERVTSTLELLEMIQMQMAGDIFCEDGRNIVWSKNNVQPLIFKTRWVEVEQKDSIRSLYQRLHAGLLTLNEAIFRNANNMAREIHGPYKVRYKGKPAQLLVREYYILKAPDLEPRLQDFPYDAVETYTLYDRKVKFDFPVLNDYTHDLPLSEHTLAVYGRVKERGRKKSLNRKRIIEKVCIVLEKKSYRISMAVEHMDREEQVLEAIRRRYYWAKNLKLMLGKDWEPSKGLLQEVRKKLKTFPEPKQQKITKAQFYRVIDPRID